MSDVYLTNQGRRVLSLRVKHLLDFDETVEILCRAFSPDTVDDVPRSASRADLDRRLRGELAFGGYEAYGHMWSDNIGGGDTADAIRDRVEALVARVYPELKQ